MNGNAILLLIAVLLCAPSAQAEPRVKHWIVPDYAKIQSGGWIGLITAGLGYEFFDDRLDVGAYYGYLPESVGGTTVHTLAWHVGVRPLTLLAPEARWEIAYFGVGAAHSFGRNFFVKVPDRYPDGWYYPPTGMRLLAFVGTELGIPISDRWPLRSHAAFVEVTAVDHYLRLWVTEPKAFPLTSVLSLSAGYRLAF